ncbi:hypothetical protein L3X38_002067 [Prunus dulcis]|uniref:Uncharacterized protein n=1 Tax=Prunus dulcis TaxID=3755 RepID=A0AAD4ZKE7_PRUDU|nr:hypothetical protein L3X38_002067 [Prunus dulcis]
MGLLWGLLEFCVFLGMSGVPEANAVTGSAKNGISDSNEGNSSSGHSKDVSSFSSVSDTKVKEVVEYDQQKDLRTLAELICSGALDPRFKMRYIEFFCLEVKHKDGKRTKTKVAIVLLAMQELFDDYVIRFPTEEESCRPRRWKRSCRVISMHCLDGEPQALSTRPFANGVYYTVPKPADEHIVCLKPDLMNALMCTRSWVW